MPRDPRVEHFERVRRERRTRAAGRYYGTQATPYGDVPRGPRQRDIGRTLLAMILLAALACAAWYLIGHGDVAAWLQHGARLLHLHLGRPTA